MVGMCTKTRMISLWRWTLTRTRSSRLIALLALLYAAQIMQADVSPDFRDQPGATVDRWDVFSKAVGENHPDALDSGSGFTLKQLTRYRGFMPPGPFLIDNGNSIYSGDQTLRFQLKGKAIGAVQTIVLQVLFDRSGPGLDQKEVFLTSPQLKEKAQPDKIDVIEENINGSTLYSVHWQLSEQLEVDELEIHFQSEGIHSSFQGLTLDIATAVKEAQEAENSKKSTVGMKTHF